MHKKKLHCFLNLNEEFNYLKDKSNEDRKYYKKFIPYEINNLNAVDIDSQEDIYLAKVLFESRS